MKSGGEAIDDHFPGWVPVKKKHRSGSKFSVQSWAGGFSGKNGSSYQLPMSSVGVTISNLSGKHRPQLSKGVKHSASVSNTDHNGIANSEKTPNLEKIKENGTPSKLLESNFSQENIVAEDNLEVEQKDWTETVPKVNWGDFDDGHISVLYPESMHVGNVKSSGSETSSLMNLNNETGNRLISPCFSSTDFQKNKYGIEVAMTNDCPKQLISLANKEEQNVKNSEKISIISSCASDNVSESSESHGETCEPLDKCLYIASPFCNKAAIEVNFQVPILVHEVVNSEIQEVPEISEVSSLSSSDSVTFSTGKSDIRISGEDRNPFKLEPYEENTSELSTSLVEKLGFFIECQSSFVLEGNKPTIRDSQFTRKEPGMITQLQLPLLPTSEEKQSEIYGSLVEESVMEVECHSYVVSVGNELEVSKSPVTLQELCMLPLSFEVDESRVSESPITNEKLGVVIEPQVLEEYELRAEPSVVGEQAQIMIESPLPPTSKEADFRVSELSGTVEKSGTEIVPSSSLFTEETESRVLESPITNEKAYMVDKTQFSFVSRENDLRVDESPVVIGKADIVDESELTLTSEEKEFRVAQSPITMEKSVSMVEPSFPLSVKENKSSVSEVNELGVLPLPDTDENLGVVVEPQVHGEYELRVESPDVVKKTKIMVESPFPLTSKQEDFIVSKLYATLENSEMEIEPSSPLAPEETKSGFPESYFTVEKADVDFISHFPSVFKENYLGVVESLVSIGKADILAKSELPLISKEKDFRVSKSPVTIDRAGTMVEPSLSLSFKENDSIVSEVNESKSFVSPVMVVDPQLFLMSKGNEMRVLQLRGTVENFGIIVEPQVPEEYELRDKSLIVVKKTEIMVESPLPLTSNEADFRVSELYATLENSGTEIEPSSALVLNETESGVPKLPVTVEKEDLTVESHFPSVSRENYLRVIESPVAIEKTNSVAESELLLISEEKEFRLSKSPVTIEKVETMVEPSLSLSFKENESMVSEVNESKSFVSAVTMVDPELLLMSKRNELRVLQLRSSVEKLGVVVEPQVPEEYELRIESPVVVKKTEIMVESPLPFTSKEADFTVSELYATQPTLEKCGTEIEPSSHLVLEETELVVLESPIKVEKADLTVESHFPSISRENRLRVFESPVAFGKANIVVESELPLITEEKEFRVSKSPVTIEKEGTMVEPSLSLSFKENESIVSEINESKFFVSSVTVVDPQLLIMSKGNDLSVLQLLDTVEKSGVVIEPQMPGEYELRAESPVVVKKTEIVVDSSLPLTSKESNFIVSELYVKHEMSGTEIEPSSALVPKETKSGVLKSSVTVEKEDLAVESHFPYISRTNYLRIIESPVAIEKTDSMAESELSLISEEKEFGVSKSPITVEKTGTMVEPSLSLSFKENESIVSKVNESQNLIPPVIMVDPQFLMSKGNDLRVLQLPSPIEKLGVVVEPKVLGEYDLRAESPVVVKKTEIMVESPLPLTSKEVDFIDSELYATFEKSGMEIEPSSPLVTKDTELGVPTSPVTVEKVDSAVESQFPFLSRKKDLRVVQSHVSIGKAESKLPLLSEEKESRVSKSPATIEKSGTVVEPFFPLSFKVNESRVFDAPTTIQNADMMIQPWLPLTSNENILEDPASAVTTENSDLMVESRLSLFSKENESTASHFHFKIEKIDTMVGSQLPLISEEQKCRASESPVRIQKSDKVVESQLPLISKEIELKFSGPPMTMENLDMIVESHVPLISKDYKSRALKSLCTVEFSDTVARSQLPFMCEENEPSISKSQVSFDKSNILVESHIPPISKENELRAPERPGIFEKLDMVAGSQLPSVFIENEFRVSKSHVTVEKLNTEVEYQFPSISKENESRMCETEFIIDKPKGLTETELPFTSEENYSRASDLPVIISKAATSLESSSPFCCHEDESKVYEAQKSGMAAKVQARLSLTSEGNESRVLRMPFEKSDVVVEPQVAIICKENKPEFFDFPFRSERSGTMVEPQTHQLPLAYEENESRYPEPLLRAETSSTLATQTQTTLALPQRCVSEVCKEHNAVMKLNLPGTWEENGLSVSEVSIISKFPSAEDLSQDNNLLLTSEKIGHAVSLDSFQKTSLGKKEGSIYTPVCDDLRKFQYQSDLSEGDVGESKERFRERLWCFLFENLNRSVDELYLLCELECNVDQMKEVVLVLEEAASDFNELTARVQEFDKVKRSSQSVDRAPSTLGSDHHRPHAHSWEVRRMTSSPHRADILYSSLEAFQKIRQERADMLAANTCSKKKLVLGGSSHHVAAAETQKSVGGSLKESHAEDSVMRAEQESGCLDVKKQNGESASRSRVNLTQNGDDCLKSFSQVETKDQPKKQTHPSEKDKERRKSRTFKPMDAWKEKRNRAEMLSSPGTSSAERARDKLMSPGKKKEKHARGRRIRNELENEGSAKLREGMHARRQRGESRHEAHLAQVARRAGDQNSKVNEVGFTTSLNEENKKLMLRQKLHDSELRRAEKLEVKKSKQKEDMAREEAVLERRKLIEAEKLQRLADTQRRKEEAQVRREEERKAWSAAREARAMEQLRKREERAKARQQEAETLAHKLAEKLRESEQRRKLYLEQIRERASMDLPRRSASRDSQGRSSAAGEEHDPASGPGNTISVKKQIREIRQRLMAFKYEFVEAPIGCENSSFGYRTAVRSARAKLGRWIQQLQRLRQARKEGASSIAADMIKFIEGRDPELQASRQAGLLDFIASALPASHTSKPEACQVTVQLLKLLRVALSMPTNRSYFLAQNLLPPIVPMLSAALENYIKIAAYVPASAVISPSKASVENMGSASELVDNFLWIVGAIIGHNAGSDEREIQMQDGLVELLTAYQVIHRLRDLFALCDSPHVEGLAFPSPILLGVHLLVVLTNRARTNNAIDWEASPTGMMLDTGNQQANLAHTSNCTNNPSDGTSGSESTPLSRLQGTTVVPADPTLHTSSHIAKNDDDPESVDKDDETSQTHSSFDLSGATVKLTNIPPQAHILQELDAVGAEQNNNNLVSMKQPTAGLLCAISETGLLGLLSLLTSALLQTNNRPFSEQQGSYILPSNFEEVATAVLKVLNNLALVDVSFIQRMLAMPDLKVEFYHLMSFLLSHCTGKWRGATDQIGLLLLESLLLLGYFALFHPENQAVLRWGKSPTILHKVCDLPFAFFSDPELMPVLAGTLVAACYGCEQNRSLVQQDMCVDMLLSLLKSCSAKPTATADNHPPAEDCSESSHHEFKRSLAGDNNPLKSSRNHVRPSRYSLGGRSSVVSGSSIRTGKLRNQRDVLRTGKTGEEMGLKHQSLGAPPQASTMLHCRFSTAFIKKAEEFFSSVDGNV